LDGLPLAIELAAGHCAAFAPEELLAALESRFRDLGAGPRDLPARQQTMRAAIGWSYRCLTPPEQTLFRRLGLFDGGFTLAAAEAVAAADPPADVAAALVALVEHNLVRPAPAAAAPTRYVLLDTVREFAAELLAADDDVALLRARNAAFFLALVEQAGQDNYTPRERAWLPLLAAESPNLRVALTWAADHDAATLRRLARGLWWFWRTRGAWPEADAWLRRALVGAEAPPADRAELLVQAADTAAALGDIDRAEALQRDAVAAGRDSGDATGLAEALMSLGQSRMERGDLTAAKTLLTESLDLWRTLPEPAWAVGCGLSLGWALHLAGNDDAAAAEFQDAVVQGRAAGFQWGLSRALVGLGHSALQRGKRDEAVAALREAIDVAAAYDDPTLLAESVQLAAAVAVACGAMPTAARLLGASDAPIAPTGYVRNPSEQAIVDRLQRTLEAALGPETAAAAREEGRLLAMAEMVALAVSVGAAERAAIPVAGDLSPRELQVLRLLAAGKSDREIAAELSLAYRTVTSYVASVFNKLSVDSRAAAAVYAVRQGLA
ncbi:MAG TPA: LuxR C-terminal-related transcriptional regulator, partial [Thermomicrobiales bacterium]|nr:LuxR C-terminal-related transcriptional regulator [Thermomicrobiales bacterium]